MERGFQGLQAASDHQQPACLACCRPCSSPPPPCRFHRGKQFLDHVAASHWSVGRVRADGGYLKGHGAYKAPEGSWLRW